MKYTLKSVRTLAATLITFGSLAGEANAVVNITMEVIDVANDIAEFTITGDYSGVTAASFNDNRLYALYDTPDTGFTKNSSLSSNTMTASNGGNLVSVSQHSSNGQFLFEFASPLSTSETFSGSVIADFNSDIFPITDFNPVHVQWGLNGASQPVVGSFQVVPEPSTSALVLGLCAFGFLARRRRIK